MGSDTSPKGGAKTAEVLRSGLTEYDIDPLIAGR